MMELGCADPHPAQTHEGLENPAEHGLRPARLQMGQPASCHADGCPQRSEFKDQDAVSLNVRVQRNF